MGKHCWPMVLLILAAFVLAGCGAQSPEPAPQWTAPAGLLPQSPQQVAKRALDAEVHWRAGVDFDVTISNNLVTPAADKAALFAPQWSDNTCPPETLAFAIYRFTLDAPDSCTELHARWGEPAPPQPGRAWIGLSNWAKDRWDWRELPAAGPLAVSAFARYADGNGTILAAVVMTGEVPAVLKWLRLGHNTPPEAVLNISTLLDRAPLELHYDSTGSQDPDGTIASYQWDWYSDGVIDLQGPDEAQPLHQVWLGGKYTTTLTVVDNEEQSASATVDWSLGEHSDWWIAGHDRMNSRLADAVGPVSLTETSTPLWEFPLGDGPAGVLLGINGMVYAGTRAGVVYEIKASDSSELHRFTEGTGYRRLRLIGPDGTVYVLVDEGDSDSAVVALNDDLSERWRITWAQGARDVLGFTLEGGLLLSWEGNRLRNIDRQSRTLLWEYVLPEFAPVQASVGDDGSIYVSNGETMAYGVHADGTALSGYWARDTMNNAPVLNSLGQLVCAAGPYISVYEPGGAQLLIFNNGEGFDLSAEMALGRDRGEERYLIPLEAEGGLRVLLPDLSLAYRYNSPTGAPYGVISGADGKIYIGENSGQLTCLKPNINPQWSFATGQNHAYPHAIDADGTLYISTQGDYHLRAYRD